jgi:hypothetical protein
MTSMSNQSVRHASATAPGTMTRRLPHDRTTHRQWAWLAGGMAMAFLVPFVLADRIGLQRDV